MAAVGLFGKPVGAQSTTPNIFLDDVESVEFSPSCEKSFINISTSRFPICVLGGDNSTVSIKTRDIKAMGWVDGMMVSGLTWKFNQIENFQIFGTTGPQSGTDPTAKQLVFAISTCVVDGPVTIGNSNDGKPGSMTVKFRLCCDGSQAAPTYTTWDVTL